MGVRQVEEFEPVAERMDTVDTQFRVGKLDGSFTDATDAEAVVEEYFKTMDYSVFSMRGLDHSKRSWLEHWFDFFEGFNWSQAGVPDFFVCRVFFQVDPELDKGKTLREDAKVQDYRFVEVKSDGDDLRQSQLKWIGSNPHFPVEVVIVQ